MDMSYEELREVANDLQGFIKNLVRIRNTDIQHALSNLQSGLYKTPEEAARGDVGYLSSFLSSLKGTGYVDSKLMKQNGKPEEMFKTSDKIKRIFALADTMAYKARETDPKVFKDYTGTNFLRLLYLSYARDDLELLISDDFLRSPETISVYSKKLEERARRNQK